MTFGEPPTCNVCGSTMFWNGVLWYCDHNHYQQYPNPYQYIYHYHYAIEEQTKKEIAELKERVEKLEQNSQTNPRTIAE